MNLLALIPTDAIQRELKRRVTEGQPLAPKLPMAIAEATRTVADEFGIPAVELLGSDTTSRITVARFAIWLILENQGMAQDEIGRVFARRESVISSGLERGRRLIRSNKAYASNLRAVLQKLSATNL